MAAKPISPKSSISSDCFHSNFYPWNFSTLVGVVYPLLGYLGIPLIIAIFIELPGLLFKK